MKPATMAKSVLIGAALLAVPGAGRADTIYENDYYGDNIVQYNSTTGAYLGQFANSDFLSGPSGMAFDSSGDLFVSSDFLYDSITEFTPGGVASVVPTGSLLDTPSGLAFDSAGNLYVANYDGNDIVKITPGGVASVFASTGLYGPMGMAFDSQGNLYVANYDGQYIEKFTPQGVGSVFATNGLLYPWGLAFNKKGNLFVANFWGNNIEEITPAGATSVFASVSGQSSLRYLAFDSAGNLYATDYANDTIMKFTPNGAGSVFANVGDNPDGIAIEPIPEPSTFALLGTLLFAAALGRPFRRSAKASHMGHWTVTKFGLRDLPGGSRSLVPDAGVRDNYG